MTLDYELYEYFYSVFVTKGPNQNAKEKFVEFFYEPKQVLPPSGLNNNFVYFLKLVFFSNRNILELDNPEKKNCRMFRIILLA